MERGVDGKQGGSPSRVVSCEAQGSGVVREMASALVPHGFCCLTASPFLIATVTTIVEIHNDSGLSRRLYPSIQPSP